MSDEKTLVERLRGHAETMARDKGKFVRFIGADDCVEAADAIERLATERQSIVHYLRQYGGCMADGDTFADEIERGWHLLK